MITTGSLIITESKLTYHEEQSPIHDSKHYFYGVYILKVKGIAKIPDYVQLRGDDFTLIAYFRVDRPEKALQKAGLGDKESEIKKIIEEIPYGKMQKLDL